MQFLTPQQSKTWCEGRGWAVPELLPQICPASNIPAISLPIPSDAGRRVALGTAIWRCLESDDQQILLWIVQSGVWPSGECNPLVEAARRGWGAREPLPASPGHLVGSADLNEGLAVLVMAILFLWDSWILPADQSIAVSTSHDERIDLYPMTAAMRDQVVKAIRGIRTLDAA